jgi:muramoyltetrapeptide carboxypeptidase
MGIFSPSSTINQARLNKGLSILEEHGFMTCVHPQTYNGSETNNQYAGSPEEKVSAFMDLWTNPEIHMIMASCGGNFSSQFLHLLDYKKIAETPKSLVGFSDTTALLSAIYAKTGIGGIFGPTVQTLGRIDNLDKVFEILNGKPNTSIDLSNCSTLSSHDTINQSSPIFAATLSVLISLAGTAYFPNLTGHILILEDIGEELSHLDRMLWQLNEVCPLKNLSGLIFGEFVDMKDTGRPLGLDFEGIIKKHTKDIHIPVLINAPIGHGTDFLPVPLGKLAKLTLSSSGKSLIFV